MSKKGGKMASIVNYRIKVTLNDSRILTGQLLAFDKHMNLVLAECEEFRRIKSKKQRGGTKDKEDEPEEELKRTLGLVILRGETIVTISVEGPPPADLGEAKGATILPGSGIGGPAGRGMGMVAPPTLRMAPQGMQAGPPPGMPGMPGMPPGFPAPPMGGFMPPPPGFGR